MLSRPEALRGTRSADFVGIALIISGHGAHLILLRSNAAKWHAFHSIHSQPCRDHFGTADSDERTVFIPCSLAKSLTQV